LVPADHFYRHLERTLDLSFVRELVRDAYADIRRPSIDPVVFCKLQLAMFSEGIRSEQRLMAQIFQRHCGRTHHVPEPSAGGSPTRIRSWCGHFRSGEFADTL